MCGVLFIKGNQKNISRRYNRYTCLFRNCLFNDYKLSYFSSHNCQKMGLFALYFIKAPLSGILFYCAVDIFCSIESS